MREELALAISGEHMGGGNATFKTSCESTPVVVGCFVDIIAETRFKQSLNEGFLPNTPFIVVYKEHFEIHITDSGRANSEVFSRKPLQDGLTEGQSLRPPGT